MTRLDGRAKVTGEYVFGVDVELPGALHGTVVRSPHPHARILEIDTRRAEALLGVRAILTGQDVNGILMPGVVSDQPVLANDRVRYQGEPVAVVAADRPEIAEEAARLIQVRYEALPILDDAEAAMRPGAMLLHEGWELYQAEAGLVREGNVCCRSTLRKGDVAKAFEQADRIVEDAFMTESVHQSHVEPRVALGVVDSAGRVTVYSNTQLPYWIRTSVAAVMGLSETDVRIVPTGIGGGFGSKLYPQIEPLVACLARKTGRPVRMIIPLEEELVAGLPRHPCRIYLRSGVRKDGTLVARQAKMILDTGAYAGSGPEIASVGVLVLAGPYRTPHLLLEAFAVHTNKTNFGAFRGPGGPQGVFALESHVDRIAEELDLDPLEFRLRNIVEEGDEAGNGQILRGVGMRECLERAAAAIEWERPTRPPRGKGLACSWWTTTLGLSMCRIALDSGGKVVVTVGTQEIGTGAIMGGVPQLVAEMMSVPLQDVRVIVADTSSGLWDFGSQGSRTLFNVGRAAQFACADLIEHIKQLAEKALEVSADELELRDGHVAVRKSPDERVPLAQLAALDTRGTLHGQAESFPDPASYDKSRMTSCLYPAFHYPSFHCHAAEVEVDGETGQVRVVRYVAAHDVGFAVNRALVEGQIHGGVAQGIGMALMEEILYREGHVLNRNWTDYKLPTCADVPDVQAIVIQHPAEGGPLGAKGLGESPVIAPPATLANAIHRAVGIRMTSLPMTPEKVWRALKTTAGPEPVDPVSED